MSTRDQRLAALLRAARTAGKDERALVEGLAYGNLKIEDQTLERPPVADAVRKIER